MSISGIEEAFKGELVFEWIYRRDAGEVGYERARSRATGVGKYTHRACIAEQISDHEEIRRVPFLGNDRKLVLDALDDLGCLLKIAQFKSTIREVVQFGIVCGTEWYGEIREDPRAKCEFDVAGIGNFHAVGYRSGVIFKKFQRLCLCDKRKILRATFKFATQGAPEADLVDELARDAVFGF